MAVRKLDEEAIFGVARKIASPDARGNYLEQVCGDDVALRARVQALLQVHDEDRSFLTPPAPPPGATADEVLTERAGTVVGPYKLLEQIGEGGFGVVYMAEQQRPVRRKVALKVLKPGMDTKQVVARFEAERQALALMDHPNIAHVFDGGETATGRPYFVMELVRGTPITDFCDQNHLAVRGRLGLFVAVCRAVQHAHHKGVIHRDLKPANVLVTLHDDVPVAKVIDFGIAKATGRPLTEKTLFTNFAQMIGTPLYMSPEQAQLSGLDVDTRSDIYALGVLLYELLTGTTPFDKERLRTVGHDEMRRILREEEPARPSTRMSTLGQAAATVSANRRSDPRRLSRLFRGELDWVVMKALEKDRNRRYETAAAFAPDVERYLHDEPVQACPPSAWYQGRKFARRNRAALGMTAAVGLALLVAAASLAGAAGWVLRDRQNRLSVTVSQVEQALGDVEALYRQGNVPEAILTAQKARGLLESGVAADDSRRRVAQWLTDLDMVARLEQVRLQWGGTDGAFWAEFAPAFRDYGIDVEQLPAAEAARRIAASPIRLDLAVALDVWAWLLGSGPKVQPTRRQLMDVVRAADPDPWRNQLRDALTGDHDALRKLAESADPEVLSPATLELLATALEGVGEQPLPFLTRCQRQHPASFHLNMLLARCAAKMRPPRSELALRHYQAALAVRPRSALAYCDLAFALNDTSQLDDKIAFTRKAVALGPNYARAHYNLGVALQSKGEIDEAAASYREAIRLKPEYATAHSNLGTVLRRQGLLDQAVVSYREAIRADPKLYQAHFNLGYARFEQGALDDAMASYRETLRLNPDHLWARLELGLAHDRRGELDEAISCCREAIRRHPGDPIPALRLNRVAWRLATGPDLKSRDPARALELAKEIAGRFPKEARFWTTLGAAHYRAGDWHEAVAALTRATELSQGGEPTQWLFLAMAHWGAGDQPEAGRCYDRAVAALAKQPPPDEELRRFQEEAGQLLGVQAKKN